MNAFSLPDHLRQLAYADWTTQMRHRITTVDALSQWIDVTSEEVEAIERCKDTFRWSITPHYASLMRPLDPSCPVRRQAVPSLAEFQPYLNSDEDPVGDRIYRKTNRVVHKYPDRVIFLVTRNCPVYCRHCTRKFHTTAIGASYFETSENEDFREDFEYIERNPAIRDVLLTGGDPLMWNDRRLESVLARLRSIKHVRLVRIGSRFPVLLPQRITPELCSTLRKYSPLWLNTHFNHPAELSAEAQRALSCLVDNGIPVQNQTVLLRGINDDADVLRRLFTMLVEERVRPYYLYHCDSVQGVSHFCTSMVAGRSLYKKLWGSVTGFALPFYVVTTLRGKIPIMPDSFVSEQDGLGTLKDYNEKHFQLSLACKTQRSDVAATDLR
jgi:lysine 2,3-aminomutase